MEYKRLYVFVEGPDDERFFDKIIKPEFEKEYDWVKVELYAGESPEWRTNFIRSIEAMNADYIYVSDINGAFCVTAKKQKIKNIDKDKIIVVIKEIEGWYIAGLDDVNSKRLKIPVVVTTTDTTTKEQFNQLIPGNESRIYVMLEILKCFSLETARQKNASFNYFVEKYKINGKGKN
ncbi:MAG: hypothetical protein ABH870_06025 [bacterium]